MTALFITTETSDCRGLVRAWESAFGPVEHFTFDHHRLRNDWQLPNKVREIKPDIVFYNGPANGPAVPSMVTFQQMRETALTVNLCSDAADTPWHSVLKSYTDNGCFDAQISLDGALHAPVDLATLTPVDPAPFAHDVNAPRDIRAGFSGTRGDRLRLRTVNFLEEAAGLHVRRRAPGADSYAEHGKFTTRCRILLNVAQTGSGDDRHHIKGRVVEAGWAGCALLENFSSPIRDWFSDDAYFMYGSSEHASYIIRNASAQEISAKAKKLHAAVSRNYTARQIYGRIIDAAHAGRLQHLGRNHESTIFNNRD